MRVRWEDFEPRGYEEMVAVLLSRLHPASQRIDGSGGDGGRDVQIVDQDGQLVHAYELKSFTGRMPTKRRKQVVRSLKRAAALRPPRWTLVVPMDPTPKEMEWFDKLRKNHDFPMEWLGKTWLDEKMSKFPDIRRYFCEDASGEALRLLRELREEQASVALATDALERLQNLRQRLSEVDPYFRYELSTGISTMDRSQDGAILTVASDSGRVDVYEKYVGALKDRPITASVEINIGPHEGALLEGVKSAFDYGLPVTIPPDAVSKFTLDAPAGLGGSFAGSELRIGSATVAFDEPLTLSLRITDGDDFVASWPVRVTEKKEGLKGAIFDGRDETGWLEITLRVNPTDQQCDATLELTPKPIMPAALVPLLGWVDACRPPHRMTIAWPNGVEMTGDMETSLGDERFTAVVEALAYLQNRSGAYFKLPLELPERTLEVVLESANLVREGHSEFEWGTMNLELKHWVDELDPLLEGKELQVTVEWDRWIDLEGGRLPIGRIRTQIESAIAADPDGLRRALAAGLVPDVRLIPADGTGARNTLVS